MNMLVADIGGTSVKILASGHEEPRQLPSGPTLTPEQVVDGVKKPAEKWKYDAVSIGYPGTVVRNRPLAEPYNLGRGWAGFDFKAAFRCPVKVVNDAVMQALGSYKGGNMPFLGFRDRPRFGHDRGRHGGTYGAGSPAL
jgi:polyphosphate glucokinase